MLLLPLFVLFASIQAALHFRLVGTYEAVIITYLTFALPFATWLMVSYLGSIPVDLEEAALCDGTTRVQALWRVIVPLVLPGMVVALVFAFLTGWSDVLFASVLSSPATRTLAVQLQAFSSAKVRRGLAPVRSIDGRSRRERAAYGDFVHDIPEIPDRGTDRRRGQGIDITATGGAGSGQA